MFQPKPDVSLWPRDLSRGKAIYCIKKPRQGWKRYEAPLRRRPAVAAGRPVGSRVRHDLQGKSGAS